MLLNDEVLTRLIRGWTREAGVRQLERQLAAVCRKLARRRASGDEAPVRVTVDMLTEWLGPPRLEDDALVEEETVGAATGLAWTPVGGDVLTVEASLVDLTDVPAGVRERLEWRLVDRVDQVLEVVLRPRREAAAALG